jgi:DNA polymerase-1
MPLLPVLVQTQVNGIAIDSSVLSVLNEELVVAIEQAERGAYEAVLHEFAINSPAQVGELLFTELKLPAGKKTKTGYSTDASILENLRKAHPVIDQVLKYRELTKLKSTYVDTLPLEVNSRTHRIHTTYNQAGSTTGRLASNDPNLQNIPVRSELGQRVRMAFIAERRPEWILLSADYSQIDLRALAHLSQDPALMSAFERDEDIHASTASLIYGVPLNEVSPDMRRLAKVMNFGVAYGLSAFGISRQTQMSTDEGGQFIADYFGTYPKVREYLDSSVAKAKETGYAETLLGRRRYLPELQSPHYPLRQAGERMALNMPVQGTSSDIINAAMIHVQSRIESDGLEAKMLLQVHDELVFELPRTEEQILTTMLHDTMPKALNLSIPLKIDVKTGNNWAQMHAQREEPIAEESRNAQRI